MLRIVFAKRKKKKIFEKGVKAILYNIQMKSYSTLSHGYNWCYYELVFFFPKQKQKISGGGCVCGFR